MNSSLVTKRGTTTATRPRSVRQLVDTASDAGSTVAVREPKVLTRTHSGHSNGRSLSNGRNNQSERYIHRPNPYSGGRDDQSSSPNPSMQTHFLSTSTFATSTVASSVGGPRPVSPHSEATTPTGSPRLQYRGGYTKSPHTGTVRTSPRTLIPELLSKAQAHNSPQRRKSRGRGEREALNASPPRISGSPVNHPHRSPIARAYSPSNSQRRGDTMQHATDLPLVPMIENTSSGVLRRPSPTRGVNHAHAEQPRTASSSSSSNNNRPTSQGRGRRPNTPTPKKRRDHRDATPGRRGSPRSLPSVNSSSTELSSIHRSDSHRDHRDATPGRRGSPRARNLVRPDSQNGGELTTSSHYSSGSDRDRATESDDSFFVSSFDPYNSTLYSAYLRQSRGAPLNKARVQQARIQQSQFHHYDNHQQAEDSRSANSSSPRSVPQQQQPPQKKKPVIKKQRSKKAVVDMGPFKENLGSKPAWFRAVTGEDTIASSNDPNNPNRRAYSSAHSDPGHLRRMGSNGGGDDESLQYAASWAPSAGPPVLNQNDAQVYLKGDVVASHSSHILAYASPVFAQHLRPARGGTYRLDLPTVEPDEWKILQPFLQPQAIEKAAVTTQNLASLLPFFHELQLQVLLSECDNLLASLTFSDPHEIIPTTQDYIDLLLLTQICSHCNLTQSNQNSLKVLEVYLTLHPFLCNQPGNLDRLMMLLRDCPNARDALWRTVVVYLPEDLPVYGDGVAAALVHNSLFPYLMREKLILYVNQQEEIKKRQLEMDRLRRWHERKQSLERAGEELDAMRNDHSLMVDSLDTSGSTREPSWMLKSYSEEEKGDGNGHPYLRRFFRNEEKDDDNMSVEIQQHLNDPISVSARALEDLQNDFAKWWQSWSEPPTARLEDSVEGEGLCRNLPGGPDEPPPRTVWLESVVKNLKRPPMFTSRVLPPSIASASEASRRTFEC